MSVRYFGGTKLGIGPMVRAYSSAAKAVIQSAQILPYEALVSYKFSAPYNKQRQIEYHLKICEIENIRREFLQDGVAWSISCSQLKLGVCRINAQLATESIFWPCFLLFFVK